MKRVLVVVSSHFIVLSSAIQLVAQRPGDGIPDLYYFPRDGLTAMTSFGPVSRDAGVMMLDTDGEELDVVSIIGPVPDCGFCDGSNLPSTAPNLSNAGSWTYAYGLFADDSADWFRTSPLCGCGFNGVIGVGFIDGGGTPHPWPADSGGFPFGFDFAEVGLGQYSSGLAASAFGDAAYIETNGPPFKTTSVTIVPEPVLGVGLALLVIAARARP